MAEGQYTRVYHLLKDEYPAVWKSDAQLALFIRLLVIADKWWPQLAPIGHRNGAYQSLVRCGLVIEKEGATGYTIRGLEKERSTRSEHGRHAASMRWASSEHYPSNASKEEKRIEEKSNGQSPSTFLRWGPSRHPVEGRAPGEAYLPRHEGQHSDCAVCSALMADTAEVQELIGKWGDDYSGKGASSVKP